MSISKKNPALIIGIALPFVFIAVLVAVVMLPSLSVKPAHDFLYITDSYDNYPGSQQYANKFIITGGKLGLQPLANVAAATASTTAAPTLFLYSMATGSSHEISVADAENLSLDSGPSSPDGYTVQYSYGNDGIFGLFGGNGDSQGYFVSKGDTSRRLNGIGSADMYPYNFQLIGWVN
jgi:hypothetical protein